MEDHPEKDQKEKQQPSPELPLKRETDIRCIAGSKVLLVRNYLTREMKEHPKPERCFIQRVVSTETLPEEPKEPIKEPIKEPVKEPVQEPPIKEPPRRSSMNRNAKVGLTLTAAVAAVGLWWYTKSE